MITEETIARMKQNLEVKNEFFVLDVIKHLESQVKELKTHCKAVDEVNEKMKCCGNGSNYRCPGFQLDRGGCFHPESWRLDE